MTDKQIMDGHDVSKGNQKYAEKYSPVEKFYRAEFNTVDGINLAECIHFTRQVDFGYCELSNDSCNEFLYNCVKNKNCYYKQLKRAEQRIVELNKTIKAKEQECEKAKQNAQDTYDLYQALIESFNILQGEKIKLEQECEELKAELELFKTSNQTTIDQLKAENEELTSKCSQLEEFPRKTRNIILEFAKGDILTFPDLSLEENCIAIQKQCLDPMRQIIQKLDEMQDENCHFDKIKELTKEM